jgi:hypothetical protein
MIECYINQKLRYEQYLLWSEVSGIVWAVVLNRLGPGVPWFSTRCDLGTVRGLSGMSRWISRCRWAWCQKIGLQEEGDPSTYGAVRTALEVAMAQSSAALALLLLQVLLC